MARKPKRSPTELPNREFYGRWAEDIANSYEAQRRLSGKTITVADLMNRHSHDPKTWDQMRQWWPIALLRKAARQGDSEGYKRLLLLFLGELGAQPPEKVVVPFRWPRGRPDETEAIYREWMTMGAPSLTWREKDKLAKVFHPKEFDRAMSDEKLRKKLRDNVGAAVKRHATKPPAISSRD